MILWYKITDKGLYQVWMPWGAHRDFQPDMFLTLQSLLNSLGCEFRRFTGTDPWAADSSRHHEELKSRLDAVIPVIPVSRHEIEGRGLIFVVNSPIMFGQLIAVEGQHYRVTGIEKSDIVEECGQRAIVVKPEKTDG